MASLVLGYLIGHISPKTSFYWLPTRAWEFLAGIFAALLFAKCRRPFAGSRVAGAAVVAGTLGILAAAFLFDDTEIFPGAQALIAVGGTVVICVFQIEAAAVIRALYTNKVMQH